MSDNTMLVEVENLKSTDLFVIGGTDDVVARIEKEARAVLQDVTTPQGRKAIASNAAKVARSKTYLDGLGKDLVAGLKLKTKAVDQERRKMRERLDMLKIEIRKPLSDFEAMEEARVEGIRGRLVKLECMDAGLEFASVKDIENRINEISAFEVDPFQWMEFSTAGRAAKQSALNRAGRQLAIAKEREEALRVAEAARKEAEEKQRQAEAKARRDREERIRAQAAKAAKAAAEKAAKDAAYKAAADAKRKLDAEKARREQAANKAREKLAREKLKREEAEKAAIDAKARLEAAEKEKELQAAQKRKAEAEKDANRANAEIEALNSLNAVVGPERAEVLLRSIILGNIRHIRFEP